MMNSRELWLCSLNDTLSPLGGGVGLGDVGSGDVGLGEVGLAENR